MPTPTAETLTWRVRLMFAAGQIPEGVQSTAFGFFLLFFYNQVLGLSGFLASLAIVVALLVDAVSDPIIGSWSDGVRHRWGRRHPFMYAAAAPFAICFYLLFSPPAGLSETQVFIWLVVFSVLTRTTQSVYSIPHTSLTAELSTDYHERTLLSSLRSLLQSVGTLMVFLIGLQIFFGATPEYPNGQLNPAAYPRFAGMFAVVIFLGVLLTAYGTHSYIPYLPQANPNAHRFSLQQVMREAGMAFGLRSFKAVVLTAVLFGMTMGMVSALSIYLGTLYFEFSLELIGLSFPASILGSFLGAGLASPLGRVFQEKKTLLMGGLIWYAVWNTLPIILSLLGLFPKPGDPLLFYLVMTSNAICSMGIGVLTVMIGSMIADITDQHEEKQGSRNEGIYFAASSFAAKAIGGFGIVVSGVVVDLAGIQRNATVETINPESLRTLAIAMGPGVLLMIGVTVVAASFYDLSRAEHRRIRAAITAGGSRE
ncbi:MAG: MFS transporter [Gammaproteobacteria bacterium]|nr:MFS transporter [Gammaproteobacteria bacterium]MBT5602380.1 MFS transporter [Gammaproteobacteria bacterium]MBT6244922.1 MFS transporter [Gammaproteobacteria bacterium]